MNEPPARVREPASQGIAKPMVSAREGFDEPLTKERLRGWQAMIVDKDDFGRLIEKGCWRTGPVCIVSGPPRESKVHFEGPSGAGPRGDGPVHRLVQRRLGPNERAGAAHVYFEVVHPFADGNGRVGRAVSEIALSQELGRPAPFSLSAAINERRDGYCSSLEIAQKGDMNVTEWLVWFADTVRRAQEDAKEKTTWVLFKTKFRDVHADSFNDRRKRVIARMFRAGIEGFEGGVDERKHAKPAECGARAAANGIVELLAMGAFKEIPSAGRRTRCDILIDR